ncbi:hypothetical protein COT48_05080 [Candidatus Woesearchaeota archaeon CG08_land_8_20_14_0_20_47_9]|nr:MAG: hypothetical protein COT48_05080 [Candidatus Woesearchaeota archaeon CG08_land_8_20_14_0_20_47_9]
MASARQEFSEVVVGLKGYIARGLRPSRNPVKARVCKDFGVCNDSVSSQVISKQADHLLKLAFVMASDDVRNGEPLVSRCIGLRDALNRADLDAAAGLLAEIVDVSDSIKEMEDDSLSISFKASKLPPELRQEFEADVEELKSCFAAGCYRSCLMICGRMLETALHRKYYDATGNDLLETAPEIGLGKLIAKMRDKNIALDPALTQQIHLVNNMRIISVHKKKEPFKPTREQTRAVVIYTLDVVSRLFC